MMESFSQFYRTHKEKLFGYLIRKTGDYHLSSDIMQESFTRLLHAYGPEEQNISLLFTIARNALSDHYRKLKHRDPPPVEHQDASMNPERYFMVKDAYRRVLDAFQQLDEADRDILSLAVSGNVSYREIGKLTGMSVANVKIRVHRARIKLKEIFKEAYPDGISN